MYKPDESAIGKYQNGVIDVFKLLRPPSSLTISQWADTYRFLSPEASAEVGKWRTDRVPYLREVMDTVTNPSIESISCMFASQVGKTEFILNVIGYYMTQDPGPILWVLPTLEMAQSYSKDRLAPMIRDSKGTLVNIVNDNAKGRSADSTILHKSFMGGHITMVGSNAPSGLAGRPVRILLMDEIDRYAISAGAEGNPISLAVRRTANYYNRKIIQTSTPAIKETSNILRAFESSDMRYFHVPCPYCGHFQKLEWKQIKFDKTNVENTVGYECEACQQLIKEGSKNKMLLAGKWIAEKPIVTHHAGFFLNGLYSPWQTWEKIVRDFLEAKQSADTFRPFVNTVFAEPWDDTETISNISDEQIRNKIEHYTNLPDGVLVLTAGIDVQHSWIAINVLGWGKGEECWVVDYIQIVGSPQNIETWEKVDTALNKEYEHENGLRLKIAAAAVDSSDGSCTEVVYDYCKKHEFDRIYAIKGLAQYGMPLVSKFNIRGKQKVKLYMIGSDTGKTIIFDRMRNETFGPGYIHLKYSVCDEAWLTSLFSEVLQKVYEKGVQKLKWVRKKRRNEVLDTFNYSLAALKILTVDFDAVEKNMQTQLGKEVVQTEVEKQIQQTTPQQITQVTKISVLPQNRRSFVNKW